MNRATIATLYRLELRSILRDRRTVILSIVLPTLVMPLMLFASSAMERSRVERLRARTYTYAVVGDAAEWGRTVISGALAAPPIEEADGTRRLTFVERTPADPAAELADRKLDAYVEVVGGERARQIEEEELRENTPKGETPAPRERHPDYAFAIIFRSDITTSQTAANGLARLLEDARKTRRAEAMAAHGFPIALGDVAAVTADNVASPSQVAGSRIARFLTVIVVFLMMMAGATVASDIIAGEKERGTIETLLTTAAARSEIVAAKLLIVVSVAFAIILLEFGSVLVYASIRIVAIPSDYAAILTPGTLLALVLLYLPAGAFVSSVLLLVSGLAKTYKEAQLFFFPVMLLSAVPAAAAVLPGVGLRSAIAVVPLAGISVAVREVLVNHYDWPMLAITWLATAGASAWLMQRAAKLLSSEELITSSDTSAADLTGGPELFPKRVLRWFAVLWVALFSVSSFEATLDIRWQVVINLVGLFLGGSLLMIWRYRLDPREALALRPVHPAVIAAVIVGAPSGLLVGLGVSRLMSYVLPVPEELIEQFSKDLFPAHVPIWQMVFFVAILPGICEEIAFRGVLLYGLRRRLRPLALCIAVGCVFGFFHMALFRLVPTAFLGVILGSLTVFTGSIFPSMLWHALNNGIAVVAPTLGLDVGGEWWHSAVAVIPLALSIWVIRRFGRGYPGLRSEK